MVASLSSMRLLLATGLLHTLASAVLQVNYPIHLQLPPVAHVDAPYQFQFAPTTFQNDSDKVQYSLVGGPSWLSLDSGNRTLLGIPRAGDVEEAAFTIAAASSGGAVVNMNSKLLVSKDIGPKVKGNVTQILSKAGQLSSPRTLSIGPSKRFDISFPSDTFDSNGKDLSYQGFLSDHTPLPAWISFDAASLRFSGTTPPTSSTSNYEILLVACDTPGYAGASLTFTIAVSNHQLLFNPYGRTLNLSKGERVQITDLKSTLFLDGSPIQATDVQSASAKLPSWLKFDDKTFEISGNAPTGTMSQDLTVTAKDQYADVAQLSIHLVFRSELFANEIGQLNATVGEKVEYKIPQEILGRQDEKLSIDFSSLSGYLSFDPTTLLISGTVTKGIPAQKVQCTLTAKSDNGSLTDMQTFQVAISEATGNSNVSSIDHRSSLDDVESGRRMAGLIIGSIVGGICCLLLLVAFAICLRRRKKNNKSYVSPKLPRSPRKSDIGPPTFVPQGWPDIDIDEQEDVEKGKEDHEIAVDLRHERPPRIDFDLFADRRYSNSLTDSIGDDDTRILHSFDESFFGHPNDIAPSQHPHDSMKIPTELAKRASQRSDTFRKHTRRTTTVYRDQIHRSSGLPVRRRITGMGHGHHTYSLSRSNSNFAGPSLHRHMSTSSQNTTSILSAVPSAFPQQTAARQHTAKFTTPAEQRRSIRIVPGSNRSSIIDRQNLDDKRNSYIRKRASAQSPFFSGAGSRLSSSIYKSPPAFIADVPTSPETELLHETRNTIVRPDDEVIEGKGKELPQRICVPTSSVSPAPELLSKKVARSLRQNRIPRPHTTMNENRDRIGKSYAKPGTASGSNTVRCGSTRDSLRAYELKTRLNDLTGSQIFTDVEFSDSVYTDEEQDIKEAENRITVKPEQFTLPPLNLDTRRRSKRHRAEKQKKPSKRESEKELKRTSERDPTPHYLAHNGEHGGKENDSSLYSFGTKPTPLRTVATGKAKATTSPERAQRATRHLRTTSDTRKSYRASHNRHSTALSHREPNGERQSRKSLHSRAQSRQSGHASKKTRDHSRTQSTPYPYFDPNSIEQRPTSIANAVTTAADAVSKSESTPKLAKVTRDLSGNLTFYGIDEEPTVEELGSSSIGFRTSNGRVNSTARRSRLASLHESSKPPPPRRSSKRETTIPTTIPFPSSSPTPARPASLTLFPVDTRAELSTGKRASTALSVIQGENRAATGLEDGRLETERGRQTWGGLKSMVQRGSRWVSGGYWEKQGKEDKAFI